MKAAVQHSVSRYQNSTDWLERALRTVPLGSQTFSKSRTQLPVGAAPLFAERGEGPYLFDLDGNRYIDFACGLGAVTLGYADADVNEAAAAQLRKGTLFSLASPLEAELAERIVAAIPCAEKVRFGKNGSDATAGCVRLARAWTGRDRVAVCGYHGWQDWYIGATARNRGVPQATRDLTRMFQYNNLASLEALFAEHPGEYACVIMEPVAFDPPRDDFLNRARDLAHRNGALFVFDEVVTGFRYPGGSAQAFLGVTPDLCALGKGLGNGFPVAAVAGRADIMALMEEVFFSFTMGGEAVSLAASIACVDKNSRLDVPAHLQRVGTKLIAGFNDLVARHGLGDRISIAGQPSWTLIAIKEDPGSETLDLKTLWIQECAARGVLNIGLHFLSLAHSEAVIDAALEVYDSVFSVMKRALESGDVRRHLTAPPLVPLFRVRG